LLELSSQPPDLAILDLGLPDGDGVDVIRTLRGWSSLPVIREGEAVAKPKS
jgi:two-component system KDP operon response regulator KdpE